MNQEGGPDRERKAQVRSAPAMLGGGHDRYGFVARLLRLAGNSTARSQFRGDAAQRPSGKREDNDRAATVRDAHEGEGEWEGEQHPEVGAATE